MIIEFTLDHLVMVPIWQLEEWQNDLSNPKWASLLKFQETWEDLCLPSFDEGSQYGYSSISLRLEMTSHEYRHLLKMLKPYPEWVSTSILVKI